MTPESGARAGATRRGPANREGVVTPASWSLVVPVKPLARAKSRLADLAGPHRERLALAVAADTVAAALACPPVGALIVVTDDPVAAPALAELGASIVADEPDSGLNPALRHGAARAVDAGPAAAVTAVAALSADLPALRPLELQRALEAAAAHDAAFVADAAGSGTTLYAAASVDAFSPRFGPGSRESHLAGGASELALDGIDTVRRDVDTPGDLDRALRLGAGPRTSAAAALLQARFRQ